MVIKVIKRELSPELAAKILEQKKKLAQITVEETDLSHPLNYKNGVRLWQSHDKNDFAELISSFFKIGMSLITNGINVWIQPIEWVKTEEAIDEETKEILNIAGIVIKICDKKGNMIVIMENQPGAQEEIIDGVKIRPKIKPSAMTSVTKMELVNAGDIGKDRSLAALLAYMKRNNMSFEDFEYTLSDSAHDTNKIGDGIVAYTTYEVGTVKLYKIAEEIGGFVLNRKEIKEIRNRKPSSFHPHMFLCIK